MTNCDKYEKQLKKVYNAFKAFQYTVIDLKDMDYPNKCLPFTIMSGDLSEIRTTLPAISKALDKIWFMYGLRLDAKVRRK